MGDEKYKEYVNNVSRIKAYGMSNDQIGSQPILTIGSEKNVSNAQNSNQRTGHTKYMNNELNDQSLLGSQQAFQTQNSSKSSNSNKNLTNNNNNQSKIKQQQQTSIQLNDAKNTGEKQLQKPMTNKLNQSNKNSFSDSNQQPQRLTIPTSNNKKVPNISSKVFDSQSHLQPKQLNEQAKEKLQANLNRLSALKNQSSDESIQNTQALLIDFVQYNLSMEEARHQQSSSYIRFISECFQSSSSIQDFDKIKDKFRDFLI